MNVKFNMLLPQANQMPEKITQWIVPGKPDGLWHYSPPCARRPRTHEQPRPFIAGAPIAIDEKTAFAATGRGHAKIRP